MLREIRPITQRPGEHPRRWFSSDDPDLIVWLDAGGLCAFESCYDKAGRQREPRPSRDGGSVHHAVDNGEERPGRHKSSPIYIADGVPGLPALRARFMTQAVALDPALRAAVLDRL